MGTVDISREHIHIMQGAGGPKPCIKGTKIRVIDVMGWYYELGWSAEKIVEEFPHITQADVFAALAYYWNNKEALDQNMADDDACIEEMMRKDPGRLQEMLKQRHVG